MASSMRYIINKFSANYITFRQLSTFHVHSNVARIPDVSNKFGLRFLAPASLVNIQNRRSVSGYSLADGSEEDSLYKTIDIEVKGHDDAVLCSYSKFVTMAAGELGLNFTTVTPPNRVIKRYTLLKSAHVHRKHMVQYEARTMFRSFQVKRVTGSTANTFLEYIQRNLPEGMAMKVSRTAIEMLPEHLHPPSKVSAAAKSAAIAAESSVKAADSSPAAAKSAAKAAKSSVKAADSSPAAAKSAAIATESSVKAAGSSPAAVKSSPAAVKDAKSSVKAADSSPAAAKSAAIATESSVKAAGSSPAAVKSSPAAVKVGLSNTAAGSSPAAADSSDLSIDSNIDKKKQKKRKPKTSDD